MTYYSYTHNSSVPTVGSVAYIHFSQLESRKREKTTGRHPYVITNIDDGVATVVGLSCSGDIFAEKNIHHFIPPESCPILDQPSFPIPHRATFTIELSKFPRRFAQLCDSAMAIVEEYVDLYESLDPCEFVPFSGATYPQVNTPRHNAYAANVYCELQLPVLTYSQAKRKAQAVNAKKKVKL